MSQIAPTPTREAVEATPRKKITRHQRAVVFLRQNGKCDGCGCKLFRPYIVDHRIPVWMGGADHTDNMHATCKPCDKPKTGQDATNRAKVKRLIAKDDPETRPRSKRPLKGRGFDKTKTRRFDGSVVPKQLRLNSDFC